MWLTICTALVGYVPEGDFKSWLNRNVSIMCFGVLSSSLSSVYTYHNQENRPKNGICVANHTSPIDALVLMCDNCYSLVCYIVYDFPSGQTGNVIVFHIIFLYDLYILLWNKYVFIENCFSNTLHNFKLFSNTSWTLIF